MLRVRIQPADPMNLHPVSTGDRESTVRHRTHVCAPLLARRPRRPPPAPPSAETLEMERGDRPPGPSPTEVVLVTHESFVLPEELQKQFEEDSGYELDGPCGRRCRARSPTSWC